MSCFISISKSNMINIRRTVIRQWVNVWMTNIFMKKKGFYKRIHTHTHQLFLHYWWWCEHTSSMKYAWGLYCCLMLPDTTTFCFSTHACYVDEYENEFLMILYVMNIRCSHLALMNECGSHIIDLFPFCFNS